MEELAPRFQKVYANLPVGLRRDIVVVLEGVGPMSWNAAYVEVENKTDVGKEILTRLDKLGII